LLEENMKFVVSALLIIAFCTMISGCGGGSSAPGIPTGKFVDGPVGGLDYVSGSQSGTTAADGTFTYEAGKTVKFSVKGIVLGEVPGGDIITPVHLAMANDPYAGVGSPQVINMVRFLMAVSRMDSAGNMTIDPARITTSAIPQPNVFSNNTATFESMMAGVAPAIHSVSVDQAESHMTASIYTQYAGTYCGTLYTTTYTNSTAAASSTSTTTAAFRNNGSETAIGTWTMTLNPDGTVTGSTSQGDTITGGFNSGTYFNGRAGSAAWTGSLNLSTKTLSGLWEALPSSTWTGTTTPAFASSTTAAFRNSGDMGTFAGSKIE